MKGTETGLLLCDLGSTNGKHGNSIMANGKMSHLKANAGTVDGVRSNRQDRIWVDPSKLADKKELLAQLNCCDPSSFMAGCVPLGPLEEYVSLVAASHQSVGDETIWQRIAPDRRLSAIKVNALVEHEPPTEDDIMQQQEDERSISRTGLGGEWLMPRTMVPTSNDPFRESKLSPYCLRMFHPITVEDTDYYISCFAHFAASYLNQLDVRMLSIIYLVVPDWCRLLEMTEVYVTAVRLATATKADMVKRVVPCYEGEMVATAVAVTLIENLRDSEDKTARALVLDIGGSNITMVDVKVDVESLSLECIGKVCFARGCSSLGVDMIRECAIFVDQNDDLKPVEVDIVEHRQILIHSMNHFFGDKACKEIANGFDSPPAATIYYDILIPVGSGIVKMRLNARKLFFVLAQFFVVLFRTAGQYLEMDGSGYLCVTGGIRNCQFFDEFLAGFKRFFFKDRNGYLDVEVRRDMRVWTSGMTVLGMYYKAQSDYQCEGGVHVKTFAVQTSPPVTIVPANGGTGFVLVKVQTPKVKVTYADNARLKDIHPYPLLTSLDDMMDQELNGEPVLYSSPAEYEDCHVTMIILELQEGDDVMKVAHGGDYYILTIRRGDEEIEEMVPIYNNNMCLEFSEHIRSCLRLWNRFRLAMPDNATLHTVRTVKTGLKKVIKAIQKQMDSIVEEQTGDAPSGKKIDTNSCDLWFEALQAFLETVLDLPLDFTRETIWQPPVEPSPCQEPRPLGIKTMTGVLDLFEQHLMRSAQV
jgi:hypothetical protein